MCSDSIMCGALDALGTERGTERRVPTSGLGDLQVLPGGTRETP